MEQHSFEDPGWAVNEEASLIWAMNISDCLKQNGQIVVEAKQVLMGEEDGKIL